MKIPISKTRLKITFLELHSDLPGANELINKVWDDCNMHIWMKTVMTMVEVSYKH